MLENPCGLLEKSACLLGTITSQVHVTSLSHAGNSEVVQSRVHFELGQWGLLLFLSEAIIPDKFKVDIGLQLAESHVFVDDREVLVVVEECLSEFSHLTSISLVSNNLSQIVVARLNILEVKFHAFVHIVAIVVTNESLHGAQKFKVLSDTEIGSKHLIKIGRAHV